MEYQLIYPGSKAVFGITLSMAAYFCYYYLITSGLVNRYFEKRFKGDSFQMNRILFNKFAGFIILGVIPGLFYFFIWKTENFNLGVSFDKIANNWFWFITLPVIIFSVNYFLAKKPDVYNQYPQMRIRTWKTGTFLLSTLGWSLYLFAYEFLFRGILLLTCVKAFGVWPAVVINVAVYSAIHMTNGMKETIGAIPFGFIACFLMIHTGTVLIPVIMHISLSVSTEFFTIKNNPEMGFKNNKSG